MELNAEVITLLTEGGVVAVTKEVFWAEAERRRKERQREKRIKINREYYQLRKAAKKEEARPEGVTPTSSSVV